MTFELEALDPRLRLRRTPAEAIEEPVSGQLIVFRQRTRDRVAGDLFMRPGGFVPAHVHARQLERFEGVSGTLHFRCGRQRRTLGPAEVVTVPAGTPHGFRNVGNEVAHFLIELSPSLRGEEGLRTLFGLQRDRRLRVTRLGIPRPVLQIAVLFNEYLDEIHLPVVPVRVQRVVFRALARLGKWRGYSSTFPEYTRTPAHQDRGECARRTAWGSQTGSAGFCGVRRGSALPRQTDLSSLGEGWS